MVRSFKFTDQAIIQAIIFMIDDVDIDVSDLKISGIRQYDKLNQWHHDQHRQHDFMPEYLNKFFSYKK